MNLHVYDRSTISVVYLECVPFEAGRRYPNAISRDADCLLGRTASSRLSFPPLATPLDNEIIVLNLTVLLHTKEQT